MRSLDYSHGNLYSVTNAQTAILEWTRAMRDTTGNLPPVPSAMADTVDYFFEYMRRLYQMAREPGARRSLTQTRSLDGAAQVLGRHDRCCASFSKPHRNRNLASLPFDLARRRAPSKPKGARLRPASHYGKALRAFDRALDPPRSGNGIEIAIPAVS
jgi:hypothetical protein